MPAQPPNVVKFVGGPLDGSELVTTPGSKLPLFIGRPTGTLKKMAVYEHGEDCERDGRVEQVYLFFEMMELEDGAAFIGKHGQGE